MTVHRMKLSELFRIGSSKRVLQSQWTDHRVPFYRGREITRLAEDGFVNNELFISEELYAECRSKNGVPKAGDIMVTAIGTIGNSYVVQPTDRFYFKDASVLWLDRTTDISSKFIDYWLKSSLFFDQLERGNGATVDTLTIQKLQGVEVNIPSRAEQERIVAILDEAFEGIAIAKANAEKNLQNARMLFISHLQSSYHQQGEGWTSARIANIAKHSLGKMLDKAKNRGDLKPYLRNLNVRWFDFDLSDVQEMKFTPEESDKYTAIKGDVLICEGGYPGRCAIWEDDEPIYFQKALHRVRFHNPLHSKWFVNYLYLMDQTGDLNMHFSGTGIQHFTGEALAKFTLPIPPDQQIQQLLGTANQLETEVVRLESIYHQKLTALDDLKKSLLHQAFTGQL